VDAKDLGLQHEVEGPRNGATAYPLQPYPDGGEGAVCAVGEYVPAPLPPDNVVDPTVLQLVIANHSVHKILNQGIPDLQEYVVSNLRKFTVDVVLIDRVHGLAGGASEAVGTANMALKATLLYENGNVVRQTQEHERLLEGDTEVMVIGGKGQFSLKMGMNALSNKLGKQRFRIKIEPKDAGLQQYEHLSVLTEPLRSVTKLERKRPEPRGAAPPPQSDPNAPLFPAADAASIAQLQRELEAERALRVKATQQLEVEQKEGHSVRQTMQQQQEQIAALNASNAQILADLKVIREQMGSRR